MNDPLRILGIPGSIREGSVNLRLLRTALARLAEQGHRTEEFDFHAHPLPIYDGDHEAAEGLPANAVILKAKVEEADAVLIASPEYNAGISPLLKNAIDWSSRPDKATGKGQPWSGKVVMLSAASPGAFGGVRGLFTVRQSLQHLEALVLSEQALVPHAFDAFDDDGGLKDARTGQFLDASLGRLVAVATAMRAAQPVGV